MKNTCPYTYDDFIHCKLLKHYLETLLMMDYPADVQIVFDNLLTSCVKVIKFCDGVYDE